MDISEKPLNIMCTSAKKSVLRYSDPYSSLVGCRRVRKKSVEAIIATKATYKISNQGLIRHDYQISSLLHIEIIDNISSVIFTKGESGNIEILTFKTGAAE